jgi:hypothetical protein
MTITTPETEIPDEEQPLVLISFDTCLHQMTMTAQEFAFASRTMAGKRDYFLCRDCAARKRGACEFTPLKHAAIITWLAGPPSPRK